MKKTKKIFVKFIMLFALCLICGCASQDSAKTAETQPEYYDFEPASDIKEGRKNIYVVLKVLTSQYWQDVVRGVSDGGADCGCNIYVGASVGESDWQSQQTLINKAVASKADAIVLAPANSSAASEYVKDIHADGIPVMLVDTILNDTDSFDTCYMTDNLIAGEYAAEEMIRLLKEKGVSEDEDAGIAIQITSASSQTVIDRLAGFNRCWSEKAPENWFVLDEVKLNNGDSDIAKQNCIDFLTQYPSVKGLFGCNNSSTVGFVNGLTEKGRSDIVLVGFDYADETAALIASDDWSVSTVVQNQYDMGYNAVRTATELFDGSKPDYKFVDTGAVVINNGNYPEYEATLNQTGENK